MNRVLSGLLIVSSIIGAGYWYHVANSKCPIPVTYRLGFVDPRFSITEDEARMAIVDAESLWEDATGRNLFTYDEQGALTVNFLFDERQQLTDEEHTLREVLDQKESVNSELREEYERMVEEYEELRVVYEDRVATYENRLAIYNGEVAHWNAEGGAPREVFERLQEEKEALDAESREIAALTRQLNTLVDEINRIGAVSSESVRDYNDIVRQYNARFTHEREFTQGDYHRGTINIYQFDNPTELRVVLAHELGHALSLGHVENDQSIMHYLMEGQHATYALTEEDLAEFVTVCGAE